MGSGGLVGKLGAAQSVDRVFQLQPFLLQPAKLELIHIHRFLQPPDRGVQIPVLLLEIADFTCQVDIA